MPCGVSMARAERLARRVPPTCTRTLRVNELGRIHAEITIDIQEAQLKAGKTQDVLVAFFELGSTGEDGVPKPIVTHHHKALAQVTSVSPQEDEQTALLCIDAELPEYAGEWVELAFERVRSKRVLIAIAAIALIGAFIASLLGPWGDPNARRGHYEGKTPEEIQRDLNAEVDWYAMEISVAPHVTMSEGSTTCELRVENLEANHCDQKLRVWELGRESDVLFESGAIAPGEYLQSAQLSHPLDVGNHTLIVEFQGYERFVSPLSNEGVPFGHNSFGASCAAEVEVEVVPAKS